MFSSKQMLLDALQGNISKILSIKLLGYHLYIRFLVRDKGLGCCLKAEATERVVRNIKRGSLCHAPLRFNFINTLPTTFYLDVPDQETAFLYLISFT